MIEPLDKGVFMLSLDTELAWGSAHGKNLNNRMVLFQKSRYAIDRLLELLEKYEIQATWAIVGHLFLDQCSLTNGAKHPEILRPHYGWYENDWFFPDPCTNIDESPEWYGKDIVDKIIGCSVKQEIGCHTFSHIRVGEPGCSKECFASELRACQVEATKFGTTLDSFVFPRNEIGHIDVLHDAGFKSFRGVAPDWYQDFPGIMPRIIRRVMSYLPVPPPIVLPESIDGIWNFPASLFYPVDPKWHRAIFKDTQVKRAKQGLRRAIKKRGIFHMWFHPFNLAADPEQLLQGLETIFKAVSTYRSSHELENLTMGALAQRLNSP